MATHPANAVFVSGDGKVSFDENGRKLDSNGNVVWGDRQSLRGANARVRPEIIEAYRREEEARRQAAQQSPAPAPAPVYQPPAGSSPRLQQTNQWAGVSRWVAPMEGQNWNQPKPQPPAWEPPPSGLGQLQQTNQWAGVSRWVAPMEGQNWNQPKPQPPAWEPPPSGLGQPQQYNWNRYQPPAWEPPPSGLGQPQQYNWNRYQPPQSYNPYRP